jgi:hypothetical protein
LKKYFTIILVFTFSIAFSQHLEIGVGAGGTNTRSDVSNLNYKNTLYAFQAFGRWNFTEAWVLRLDYKYMALQGLDKNNNTPISQIRNYNEFSRQIHQFSVNGEYNFLNFRSSNKKVKFCPYITAGAGLYRIQEYEYGSSQPNFNFCIPFGLGIKYALTKNFNVGAVFETTKTFNSQLDNITSTNPKGMSPKIKAYNEATNDWFYFLGINVSYTFYTINCPDFYDF